MLDVGFAAAVHLKALSALSGPSEGGGARIASRPGGAAWGAGGAGEEGAQGAARACGGEEEYEGGSVYKGLQRRIKGL